MSILYVYHDGEKYLFLKEPNHQMEIILRTDEIDQLLEEGSKEELQILFQKIIQSEEFHQESEEIKKEVQDAQDKVERYKDKENEYEKFEGFTPKHVPFQKSMSEKHYTTSSPQLEVISQMDYLSQDSRYPEAKRAQRTMHENLEKMKARLQLLKVQEQKKLAQVHLIDLNHDKIRANKEVKLFRIIQKRQHKTEVDLQLQILKNQIQYTKEMHQQILEERRGRKGQKIQQQAQSKQAYQNKIRSNYESTLKEVMDQNKALYESIKIQEQRQMRKSQELINLKIKFAQRNYQQKVESQLQMVQKEQGELDELEKVETKMLQRLKITQQIFQNSNQKLKQIKATSVENVLKYTI